MRKEILLGWVSQMVAHPLYVAVAGSRMCGYGELTSDWDIYVLHKPKNTEENSYETPKISIDGERVSFRLQPIEEMERELLEGNVKLIEKLHSPLIWWEDSNWRDTWGCLPEPVLIVQKYIEKINRDLDEYRNTLETKPLVYAYRRTWSAWHYLKTQQVVVDYQELDYLYPSFEIRKVGDWKRYHQTPHDPERIIQIIEWQKDRIKNEITS